MAKKIISLTNIAGDDLETELDGATIIQIVNLVKKIGTDANGDTEIVYDADILIDDE